MVSANPYFDSFSLNAGASTAPTLPNGAAKALAWSPPKRSSTPPARHDYRGIAYATPSTKSRSRTRHFEWRHQSPDWHLNMDTEVSLGILPKRWSVTSSMDDPRPNGTPLFDARFDRDSPVGRARAGRSMAWSAVGTADAGGTKAFANVDIGNVMAEKNAAKVKQGTEAAKFAEYYDGVRLSGTNEEALALSQMSAVQKGLIDKDGDGSISANELKKDGMTKHALW